MVPVSQRQILFQFQNSLFNIDCVPVYNMLILAFFLWLTSQIKDGFAEGKDLVVSVMSSMGEEQICALKDIGPK